MIMQTMRRAETPRPNRKPESTLVGRIRPARAPTVLRFDTERRFSIIPAASLCRPLPIQKYNSLFYWCFLSRSFVNPHGTGIAGIQANPLSKECIMKLQFGKNQLVLELSTSPFAWFHGQTERMSLTSLSLLFVQFSLFARQPAVRCKSVEPPARA